MLEVNINSFSYSEKEILKNIFFKLENSSHLAILGESGCGKSTLLHLIYGLLHLEDGSIKWNGKYLNGPNDNLIPGEPFMKLVAQEFDIMPFTTVSENIASYLTGMNQEEDKERVAELLKVVDLQDFSNISVKQLSGGQKQRVALAKALAKKPELILLDEPFSNIDTFRRNQLRRELFDYLKKNNISCITATHDSEEALSFADEIMIIRNGSIEVSGTPQKIYYNLKNSYEARFFGDVNILPSTLFNPNETAKEIIVFPHELKLSEEKSKLQVCVKNSYFKGNFYLIQTKWNGQDIFFENPNEILPGTIIKLIKA